MRQAFFEMVADLGGKLVETRFALCNFLCLAIASSARARTGNLSKNK
jgi:hypothetical protein